MADWRQIQARIRKARASSNPAEQLAELHQRTRDAMVAFELARLHEKNGDNAEAAKWYTTAAQQFRRAQWRVKAEEALARLGAEVPARIMGTDRTDAIEESGSASEPSRAAAKGTTPEYEPAEEENEMERDMEGEQGAEAAPVSAGEDSAPAEAQATAAAHKRRRRGRRGGRKHRKIGTGAADQEANRPHGPAHAAQSSSPARSSGTAHSAPHAVSSISSAARSDAHRLEPAAEPRPREVAAETELAEEPRYQAEPSGTSGRARGAEPALSSRMAQLESRLRRLLACQLAVLADADDAPAGPGVLLLSDSDQVTYYYIEACQTLRIGIANLLRGGRGSKEGGRIKQVMAENLGINESSVSKYMKDHCVVRWLQLDEGAPELAHFAIAVLRPVVNE